MLHTHTQTQAQYMKAKVLHTHTAEQLCLDLLLPYINALLTHTSLLTGYLSP